MATDAEVTCPVGSWTKVVNNIATDVTFSVISQTGVYVLATAADSAPTEARGWPLPWFGNGWNQATLAELFPGISSAAYLWAKPSGGKDALVRISHA